MKNRSETSDKVQNSEQHRQLAQTNPSGDTHAPASPALTNGAKLGGLPNLDRAQVTLAQLAQDFKKAHEVFEQENLKLQAAYTRSVSEVAKLGRILIDAKNATKKAKLSWMDWVTENTSISHKTAQRWMLVAKKSSAMSKMPLTGKNLTEFYQDIGIVKKKTENPKIPGVQNENHTSTEVGEGSETNSGDNADLFTKAKSLADRLAQLAVQTSDQERMAQAIKSIIAWHDDYLAIKTAEKQKAKQDAEFNKETSTVA